MSWLLTKLRGVYRVMADGVALPDVPAINFIASTPGTIGAVYNAAKNRIDVTLPFGSTSPDSDTFVLRDPHGDIEANEVRADVVSAHFLNLTQDATIGGGVGQFGAPAPSVKPDITGSRGGNAALANLLNALAASGAIKNSTT
jgi:hypothetical protein